MTTGKKTEYYKLIAVLGISSTIALLLGALGIPFVTAYWQYHCVFCPAEPTGINWYFVANSIIDFLVWFSVGIVAIFSFLLARRKIRLFESVSEEVPFSNQN